MRLGRSHPLAPDRPWPYSAGVTIHQGDTAPKAVKIHCTESGVSTAEINLRHLVAAGRWRRAKAPARPDRRRADYDGRR